MNDSYALSAKYYDDCYAAKPGLVDGPFYLELAQEIGGPVLELGCGTGRVLLPIARAGIEIHGVDASAPMLYVLRERIGHEPVEVQRRVQVFEGDMRTFRGKPQYALVTIPFRPMQHMFTQADQLAALRTAAWHLREDGVLALDVFFPNFESIYGGIGEEKLELSWPVKGEPGRMMRRYFRKEAIDKINQTFSAKYIFRTFEGDKWVSEESEPLKMAYYTYPQMKALFQLAGLESVEEYGSFAKARLDNATKEMIFLLKRG